MEDLNTWPFKLTQNMVQKNNDEIEKTQIKSHNTCCEKELIKVPKKITGSEKQ